MAKQIERKWKPSPNLTRKQNAFVHHLITHPKESATDAVAATYDTTGRRSDRAIASGLLNKPSVKMELAKYAGEAEGTVYRLMKTSEQFANEGGRDGASYGTVALSAAKDILDRVHGKATQRTENLNVAVELNVNLS